jgi:hypothetical protein
VKQTMTMASASQEKTFPIIKLTAHMSEATPARKRTFHPFLWFLSFLTHVNQSATGECQAATDS